MVTREKASLANTGNMRPMLTFAIYASISFHSGVMEPDRVNMMSCGNLKKYETGEGSASETTV